ncbi:MAG: hypothetical protein HUU15_17610 [Candidatus Brocadiae bacterium]|nr:hypothetical protein [Candidatus Brocadiia bacterium]
MIRTCPNCRKIYDTAQTVRICPHCGTAPGFSGIALAIIVFAAVFLLSAGIFFAYRPFGAGEPTPRPSVPFETPPEEFPAAGVTIRPPEGWTYLQRDPASIAFTSVFGGGAVRFRVVEPVDGPDAHLELFRQMVPGARPVDFPLPEWPGAAGIAVRLEGDPRLGASWILPRGSKTLQIVFWGADDLVRDVDAFRTRLILGEEPR